MLIRTGLVVPVCDWSPRQDQRVLWSYLDLVDSSNDSCVTVRSITSIDSNCLEKKKKRKRRKRRRR